MFASLDSKNEEGPDVHAFLRSDLPKVTALTFDLPLEFQREQRLGPRCPDGASRPCLIIACLLQHGQTRQLLQAAQTHGPFQVEGYDIRLTADYSKDTNDCRKAFLALWPHLRQLEMKYGLFNPGECVSPKIEYPKTTMTQRIWDFSWALLSINLWTQQPQLDHKSNQGIAMTRHPQDQSEVGWIDTILTTVPEAEI
ncbi:hypothetical protein NDU88_005807 [Pleurodeles waltl]|uniref:Uncharacterized protein n=1 Tax=Pleurodeles waltl TaxID=8319 RepID=A0AAV7TVW6_PLEWA|nr:hypothetical protein NDU88_005807 [Pleurodeles waltl]